MALLGSLFCNPFFLFLSSVSFHSVLARFFILFQSFLASISGFWFQFHFLVLVVGRILHFIQAHAIDNSIEITTVQQILCRVIPRSVCMRSGTFGIRRASGVCSFLKGYTFGLESPKTCSFFSTFIQVFS